MSISRFFRFVDEKGSTRYGEVPEETNASSLEGSEVSILSGDMFGGFSRTDERRQVHKIICPVEGAPIVICVGLNYHSHAKEANMSPCQVPVVFTKPSDALTGPNDRVQVHRIAQADLDYEAELCVIIGKDGKDISEADALDYVLGYTAGNDVSARKYQEPAFSGNQYCYAKSFDGFAPIGPCVATTAALPDPQKIQFSAKVNGKIRQQSSTDEMIFSVRQIIAHLSQGTTLRKGTVIMTGTPAGVGHFMSPKGVGYIKDGDVVEIEFEGIGVIANQFVFAK